MAFKAMYNPCNQMAIHVLETKKRNLEIEKYYCPSCFSKKPKIEFLSLYLIFRF